MSNQLSKIELGHRFRFEQRIRENITYRIRYRFTAEVPLNGDSINPYGFALELHTESLLSLKKRSAAALDQRFEVGIEKQIFDNTEISLSVEYQYDDYLHNPQPELFIYTGISIEI